MNYELDLPSLPPEVLSLDSILIHTGTATLLI